MTTENQGAAPAHTPDPAQTGRAAPTGPTAPTGHAAPTGPAAPTGTATHTPNATHTDTAPRDEALTGDESSVEAYSRSRRRHHKRRDPLGLFLGVAGELLITAGVFLGLFVVWQVWWTDLQAKQYTGGIINEMAIEAPGESQQIQDTDKRVDEPAPLPPPPLPDIPNGAYAILHIPKFGSGYQVPIAEGVSLDGVLHKGLAGHYPETAAVGQVGNFAIAGHRQSHGAIFHHIDTLAPGDSIVVQTADTWYVYQVNADPSVVLPTAVEVIAPNPGNPAEPATTASMTLTTCHPLWSTAERLIVHAELDYWAPIDSGTPAELLEG